MITYEQIVIRDTEGLLHLQDGTGVLRQGVLEVVGELESGLSFAVDATYAIKGRHPGLDLDTEGVYLGSIGQPEKYRFALS